MRLAAQISMALAALYIVLVPARPLLLFGVWYVVPLLMFLPAWYFIFNRHRENQNDELMLKLEAIANAIRESHESRERQQLLHR